MNWKLILQLSLFGLAMGIATVFLIPGRIEPLIWLVILAISAYVASGPLPNSPRLMMALTGPVIGLLSGAVLGLLAIGASKLVPRRAGPGGPGASAL